MSAFLVFEDWTEGEVAVGDFHARFASKMEDVEKVFMLKERPGGK